MAKTWESRWGISGLGFCDARWNRKLFWNYIISRLDCLYGLLLKGIELKNVCCSLKFIFFQSFKKFASWPPGIGRLSPLFLGLGQNQ